MEHAHRGEVALNAGKHEEAVVHYTEAIKQSSSSPTYYIKRSIAYQRLAKTKEALHDAEVAVVLAKKRAKRELIAQAQLRRGIALYHQEKYGDAEFLFGVAKRLDNNDKSFEMWDAKVKLKIRSLAVDEESKKEVTVKEMPDLDERSIDAVSAESEPTGGDPAEISKETPLKDALAYTVSESTVGVQTPANKIRHEWYQNSENVYITILAKGIPKDQASIDIETDSLTVSFPLATGSGYDFSLEPLFAAVDPATSSFKIFSTKLEITLKKSLTGQKWSALEGTFQATAPPISPTANTAVDTQASLPTPATAPAYPTSSRKGPKNWDQIVNNYSQSKKPTDPTSRSNDKEQPSGTELIDDDDDEGDGVDKFFKQLYKGASDDTRRAMMKSYQESGGTALSTNWEEVKKAPVPISPPDGMEAKKW